MYNNYLNHLYTSAALPVPAPNPLEAVQRAINNTHFQIARLHQTINIMKNHKGKAMDVITLRKQLAQREMNLAQLKAEEQELRRIQSMV